MAQTPTLVVMAAGMGSRFGGFKQIAPLDEYGHLLIDFSLYDAQKAGFERVLFVIQHSIEDEFKRTIGARVQKHFDVQYAFQEIGNLPPGICPPKKRLKPWGTAHAILCAAQKIHGSFAVINSDDFYGYTAIRDIFRFLSEEHAPNEHAMVGYLLRNTLTEYGYVARGICSIRNGMLERVVEHTHIEKCGEDAVSLRDGLDPVRLQGDAVVSMNLWGFQHSILPQFQTRFASFLRARLPQDPLGCEFYLPAVANAQLEEKIGTIRVLPTSEQWYGMTYREDLAGVKAAIAQMRAHGQYPAMFWEDEK